MILPDDVDEKIEFWVGETDTEESDYGSDTDQGTVVGVAGRSWKTASVTDSRALRSKVRSRKAGGSRSTRRRNILGNGLLAVQSEGTANSRSHNAIALKLEMHDLARGDEGKSMPFTPLRTRRNQSEKTSQWGTFGSLPNMGSEPVLSRSLISTHARPAASSTSLGDSGHERLRTIRPPGLGLDLWSDYGSPRPQPSFNVPPRQGGASTSPSRTEAATLGDARTESGKATGGEREGSIDEEYPQARHEEKSKQQRKGMLGAIWSWAWHWR